MLKGSLARDDAPFAGRTFSFLDVGIFDSVGEGKLSNGHACDSGLGASAGLDLDDLR